MDAVTDGFETATNSNDCLKFDDRKPYKLLLLPTPFLPIPTLFSIGVSSLCRSARHPPV